MSKQAVLICGLSGLPEAEQQKPLVAAVHGRVNPLAQYGRASRDARCNEFFDR